MTVVGFAGVHAAYILRNETTIEHLADRPNEIRVDFDMSGQNYEVVSVSVYDNLWERKKGENWRQVMGNSPWGWFCKEQVIKPKNVKNTNLYVLVPIKRGLGDGAVFPYNDAMFSEIVDRARKQRENMDIRAYEIQPLATNTSYEQERLSSIESTAHMT